MIDNTFFLNNYKNLVKFNLKKENLDNIDILNEITKYLSKLDNWDIYPWDTELIKPQKQYDYPNVHPHHQRIIDICSTFDLKNILEIGSGNGKITKYLFHKLNNELEKILNSVVWKENKNILMK